MNFDTVQASCPYCGEVLTFEFDPTMGKNQVFEEDCHVCCKCITVHLKYVWKTNSRTGKRAKRIRAALYTEDDSFRGDGNRNEEY
jgi:Cysteine-rich CPXCG